MSQARAAARTVNDMSEEDYRQMRRQYNDQHPYASELSFEEYLEEAARAGTEHGRVTGRDVSGPRGSGHRSQEGGRSSHDRGLVSRPRPRGSEHRSQEGGRSTHDRSLVPRPSPREEAERSNNDRTLISRPRPREDEMHHATGPSHGSESRCGTGCRDCDDSLDGDSFDDDPFDEAYSDNDTLAHSPGTSTSRFSADRTLPRHGTDHSRETDSRSSTFASNVDEFEDDDDYDDDAREVIRPTTRRGPISRPQRRVQSPPLPPRSVQPPRVTFPIPSGGRIPPSPFTFALPAQPPLSARSAQADGRTGAGHGAPLRGTQRGPPTADGTPLDETCYDPRGGPRPGDRRRH